MLTGSFQHTVDEKNRLSIPSKWREYLEKDGKELYITRGYDGCLSIYSSRQFKETVEKIHQLPSTKKNVRTFLRTLGHDTFGPLELDIQGRILIPQPLRDFAEIDKEALLVGAFDKIEVWNPKHWTKIYPKGKGAFERAAESIPLRM